MAAYAILRPQVQAGKVKVLALINSHKAASLPDIPTTEDMGFKSLTMDGLTGLFGPREMAPQVRARIAADIKEVVADPAIAARLTATGQVVNPGTPAELAAAIDDQRGTVKRIGNTGRTRPPSTSRPAARSRDDAPCYRAACNRTSIGNVSSASAVQSSGESAPGDP